MNKATILALVLLVVIAVGAVLVNREFRSAQARPAVQRLDSQRRLREHAEALAGYMQRHGGEWPDTIAQLRKDAHLPFNSTAVPGAGIYRYRKPPTDAPGDYVVMWSDGNHAGVHKGEPWGAAGEVAGEEVPPVAFVLTKALTVETLTLDEFSRRAPPPAAAK